MADSDRAWATPGTSPDALPVASAPLRPPAERERASRSARRPLRLQPSTMLEVLDAGFAIIRFRPLVVLGVSAAFVVPVTLLVAWLQRDALNPTDFLDLLSDPSLVNQVGADGGASSGYDALVVSLVLGSLSSALAAACIAWLVTEWYRDADPGVHRALAAIGRRAPAVAGVWTLVHVLQVLGLFIFGVGLVIVAVVMVVSVPVVVVEQRGVVATLRRSRELTGLGFGRSLGFFVSSGLMAQLVAPTLSLVLFAVGFVAGVELGWIAVVLGQMIAAVVVAAFIGAATTAFYFDLRVRGEGLDLEMRFNEVFSDAP